MAEKNMLVITTNSPLESLAVSEYQGITVEKEIKVDNIASRYYLVTKAD
jgi:hypothetical protein